ncbi:secondary thiamine-phosphate synthase enzyme YjbQ [Paenibacillus protaetiae]|uniref:YjbQ family protein n=1 Tax=Paenibacillus protaetiae TaxID=2509456 RepID=A0A4P6EY35_9BACL|nr:secondary thiamine-phosphate synthase enzyme YjbQ [Paenibacillus protaetiae]QAY67992.1 YjbQ family protein [Paenibacillus protaetiae]
MHTYEISTRQRDQMVEITRTVQQAVQESGVQEGMCIVYCPHTTAGIAINENADPDVVRDVLRRLDELYPWEHQLDRHAEGNTAAHLKAIQTGTSQTVLIERGRLLLGTWQGIYFCEYDGPRTRTFHIKIISG